MSTPTTQVSADIALRLLAARQGRPQRAPSGQKLGEQGAAEAEALPHQAGGRGLWLWLLGATLLLMVGAFWLWAPADWRAWLSDPVRVQVPSISQLWGLGTQLPSGAEVAETIRSRERADMEAELVRRAREITRLNVALRQQETVKARETEQMEREAAARAEAAQAETAVQSGGADGARLMQMYAAMRPRDIARIFANLGDDPALWILHRLDPDTAAKVLVALDPARAATLSKRLLP